MSHPLIFVHVLDWSLRNHWTPAGYLILSWRCLNMPYMTIDIHCIPGNVKKRKLCTIRWSSQHDHINKYRTYSQCKSLTRRSCPTPLLCVKCVTDIAIFLCLSLVITGDALSLDWVSATVYESRNTELVFAGPGRMLVEAALSSPSVLETLGSSSSPGLHQYHLCMPYLNLFPHNHTSRIEIQCSLEDRVQMKITLVNHFLASDKMIPMSSRIIISILLFTSLSDENIIRS